MSVSSYAKTVMEYDDGIPEQTQQTFIAEKVVWDKFLDTNQGNYNFNKVNFSSLGSQGISPDVLQSWSQAYFEPAIQANLEIQPVYEGPAAIAAVAAVGGVAAVAAVAAATAADLKALTNNLKFDRTNTQNGCCIKNNIHLADWLYVKWSNMEVVQNANFQNFFRYLQMLNWNDEKVKTRGKLINYSLDNGKSIKLGTYGERNNGSDNPAHADRCKIMNYNLSEAINSRLEADLDTNKLSGYISGESNDTKLVYHWFPKIPLALQHDFFNNLPSVGAALNFDINFQLNCGAASSWNIIYKVEVDMNGVPFAISEEGIEYQKGAGNCCPFLVGKIQNSVTDTLLPNLLLNRTSFNAVEVTTVTTDVNGTITTTTNPIPKGTYRFKIKLSSALGTKTYLKQPCSIYMPSIKYNPDLASKAFQGQEQIYYSDYIMEELRGLKGGKVVRHAFNNNLSKVTKLYVIPILSNTEHNKTNKFATPATQTLYLPYESPLSSCPNTFNPGLKFSSIMLYLGNQTIYPQRLHEENDFYHHMIYNYFATDGANVLQSDFQSTQLTLERFREGYGVYVFDMINTIMPEQFAAPRSWQFEYKFDSDYDFDLLFFFEQEKNLTISRADGSIVG